MTPSDAAFAAARDTAEAAARRKAERAMAWAEHLRDALLVIEEDDDEA